jgi:hypothetical protein
VVDKVWIEKLAIQDLCSRYCQTTGLGGLGAMLFAGWGV